MVLEFLVFSQRHDVQPPLGLATQVQMQLVAAEAALANLMLGDRLRQEHCGFDQPSSELILALKPEVERLCLHAAMQLGVINSFGSQSDAADVGSLIRFFPRESARLVLCLNSLRRNFTGTSLCRSLTAFVECCANGKAKTLECVAGDFGSDTLRLDCKATWQAVCVAGLEALSHIGSALFPFGIAADAGHNVQLVEMMTGVIAGREPPLDGNGCVVLPDWAERRSTPRLKLNNPVLLLHAGRKDRAVMRDISVGGMGLETELLLETGEPVTVFLNDTFHKLGHVAWCADGRAGVKSDLSHILQCAELRFLTRIE